MTTATVFEHEMLREIFEQPKALADTIDRYAPNGKLATEVFQPVADALRSRSRLVIAASGSSRHAGLAAEIMLSEDLAGLVVDVEYASEYVYRSTHTIQDPGVLVISQSGETAGYAGGGCGKQRNVVCPRWPLPTILTPAWRWRQTHPCPPALGRRRPFLQPRALLRSWLSSTRLPFTWRAFGEE